MPGFANDEQVRIDPLRVIEAVTAGVAFLAAGMIVFSRGRVKGLTTGAGMWLSGAIGLAMGFGYWPVAFFATAAAVCVLFALGKIEQSSRRWKAIAAEERRRFIREPPGFCGRPFQAG